jgi:AP endonuclease-1
MSRRSSRRVKDIPSYEEEVESTIKAIAVPIQPIQSLKGGRKSVLSEQVLEQQTTTANPRTKIIVSVEESETALKEKRSPAKSIAKREATDAHNQTISNSAPKTKAIANTKRKVKVDEENIQDIDEKKVTKKRKTKEDKEAESMPLAARTSISTLKKAMYIGAHVSAAGGEFPFMTIISITG